MADGGEWRTAAAAEGRRALEQRISVAAARWEGGGGSHAMEQRSHSRAVGEEGGGAEQGARSIQVTTATCATYPEFQVRQNNVFRPLEMVDRPIEQRLENGPKWTKLLSHNPSRTTNHD